MKRSFQSYACSGISPPRSGLGLRELPRFGQNILRDQDLINRFVGLHRALDGGSAGELRQRELLVGMTPHAYLTQIRLEAARSL